jgi:hypothetical protein
LNRSLYLAGERIFGVKSGRVRYVSVATDRLLDKPRILRRMVRRAGV